MLKSGCLKVRLQHARHRKSNKKPVVLQNHARPETGFGFTDRTLKERIGFVLRIKFVVVQLIIGHAGLQSEGKNFVCRHADAVGITSQDLVGRGITDLVGNKHQSCAHLVVQQGDVPVCIDGFRTSFKTGPLLAETHGRVQVVGQTGIGGGQYKRIVDVLRVQGILLGNRHYRQTGTYQAKE